jgi:hypothetical protein
MLVKEFIDIFKKCSQDEPLNIRVLIDKDTEDTTCFVDMCVKEIKTLEGNIVTATFTLKKANVLV